MEETTMKKLITEGQGEEPVVPEYIYGNVASQIDKVNEKIMKLRHAIQVHKLGKMRKASPVTRVHNKDKKAAPEFVYIN